MASTRSESAIGRTPAAPDDNAHGINARLAEAAVRGEMLEVILVLRGKVRVARGSDRWRIREAGGKVLTFRASTVVAVTSRGEGSRVAKRTRV